MSEYREHHFLKILPEYFDEVAKGNKNFEIRKNDRDYQVGDFITLWNYHPEDNSYRGYIKEEITFITHYEQQEGYVVLGVKVLAIDKQTQRRLNLND